ncbi:MAG: CHAT domain-containing protein [Sodalinema sp.]|uniref:CHAT domain-containing protein n=1 Tax=Sodalinema sp. TaxID=3080550 RepID=UPI00396F57EA
MRVRRSLKWLVMALLLVLLLGKSGLGTPTPVSAPTVFEQWRSHYQNQDYEAALESLSPILESAEVSRRNRALAYNYRSLTQQKQGDWPGAEAAIERSWALVAPERERSPLAAPDQRLLAAILTTRGQVQFARGQAAAADESWHRATTYYRQLDYEPGIVGGVLNQAQALQELGFLVGACDRLLSLVQGSLKRSSQSASEQVSSCQGLLGQSEPRMRRWLGEMALDGSPGLEISLLQGFGNTLAAMGNLAAAEMVFDEAQRRSQRLPGWDDRELALDLGNLYGAKARRYQQLGIFREGFDEARRQSLESYQMAETGTAEQRLRSQLNQVSLLVDLDLASSSNPNPDSQAQEMVQGFLTRLPSQLQQQPLSRQRGYGRVGLACQVLRCDRPPGETALQAWDVSAAAIRQLLEAAQADAEGLGDDRLAAYVWGALGRLEASLGNLRQAQAETEQAIALAERTGSHELLYRGNWQLAHLREQQGLDSLDDYQRAFESLKALRFNLTTLDPNLRFAFREKIEPIYREYAKTLFDREQMTQSELRRAIEVMDALQIAEINDFFGAACLEVRSHELGKYSDTTVIYILTFANKFEVILETPDQTLKRYPVSFSEDIDTFLDSVQLSLISGFNDKALLTRLYHALISPIEDDLAQINPKQLAFVLSGKIRKIPMAALYDGQAYLIENYPIAISPSLELLEPRGLRIQDIEVIAAGRETFDSLLDQIESQPEFRALRLEEFANINLKFVEHELTQISDLVETKTLFAEEFTVDRLEQEIQSLNYPIVHIATHGRFSNFAEDTFILADRPLKMSQLADILNVKDPTRRHDLDLLVLSACQTAQESDRAVLGMAGIAARAGVRTIIGSFWAVDDYSTAWMMEQFYQGLKSFQNREVQVNKAQALRQAQMAMIRGDLGPNYTRPYFWAPFVLIGHWN